MITKKQLSVVDIYRFAGQHLVWLVPWMFLVTALNEFTSLGFFKIPWLPLSLIGTAVAFYVGFKNNQSYDRLWEARKIWGTIVNTSRKFASMVKHLQSNEVQGGSGDLRKAIIYRHIGYIYQFREQMLRPTRWEHVELNWIYGKFNRIRRDKYFANFKEELDQVASKSYLTASDEQRIGKATNKAAQILDLQTEAVQSLYAGKQINEFQQVDIQSAINSLYDEQGKAERIKNYPFPRQYASLSFVFICLFVFLLPFGIVGEFAKLGEGMVWLTVPVGVIIGFVYVMMELIGDYSENPFEGLHNDVPMLAICRSIEIDLLEMLGDEVKPEIIKPKQGILL